MNNTSQSELAKGEQAAGTEGQRGEGTEGVIVKRVEGAEGQRGEGAKGEEHAAGVAAVGAGEEMVLALPVAQRVAIERLTLGETHAAAARAAGVSRMTVWRWRSDDAAFIAAYNAYRRDLRATTRARFEALGPVAVAALEKRMEHDGWLALRVVEKLGIARESRPGATEKEEVERVAGRKLRKKQVREREEEVGIKQREVNVGSAETFAEMGVPGLELERKCKERTRRETR